MLFNRWMNGAAALTLLAMVTPAAFAQSTGTQEVEKVTVTGQRSGTGGLIIKEKTPKTRSTVDQTYLRTQAGGQTVFQSLNLAPGLNFTNSDAYGSSGGNVRLRGFDGARVSLTSDGIPLNDTGNYAIFTNQMVDPEVMQRATISTGSTDVDSPTASATGGTINLITRKPKEETALDMALGYGSENYYRAFVAFDTGETRDGLSAFFTGSTQSYDKFKGPGQQEKQQVNFRVLQEVGSESSVSLIGHYNQNRNTFYRNLTAAQYATLGRNFDNFATCTRDAPTTGVADLDGAGADTNNLANPSSCTNYFGLRINPSNTGNLRAQMNFQLNDSLRLTIDPSWQYVKANGGGTTVINENDRRLIGTTLATGVDLNGDGDLLDQVRLYTPNNTNTSRFGVTTSLIYELDESNRLRLAYTGDFGRHRQTGAFSKLDAFGNPVDVFGGLDGDQVYGADGTFLRGRDRRSFANLNQLALSYTGKFMDDALRIDLGVRAPYFKRKLKQNCFTQANTSTVRCTTETFTDANGDGVGTLAFSGSTAWVAPYRTQFDYDAVLPNVAASFEFLENTSVYASYAEGLSAPRTDNLYTVRVPSLSPTAVPLVVINPANVDLVVRAASFPGVEPETSKAYDLGLRYQGDELTGSVALWKNDFQNRIVSTFDPETGTNIDRNVGAVELQGVDIEVGYRPSEAITVYASASFLESELQDDILNGLTGPFPPGTPQTLPTKGKALVETPETTLALRAQYAIVPALVIGVQGKYVGDRWATDLNDEIAPSYTVVDADVRFDLASWGWEGATVQLNAINLFDKRYFGNISTTTNAITTGDLDPIAPGVQSRSGSSPTYAISAPATVQIQLKAGF
jgi:iron complex outermembrane receptor protein